MSVKFKKLDNILTEYFFLPFPDYMSRR